MSIKWNSADHSGLAYKHCTDQALHADPLALKAFSLKMTNCTKKITNERKTNRNNPLDKPYEVILCRIFFFYCYTNRGH